MEKEILKILEDLFIIKIEIGYNKDRTIWGMWIWIQGKEEKGTWDTTAHATINEKQLKILKEHYKTNEK